MAEKNQTRGMRGALRLAVFCLMAATSTFGQENRKPIANPVPIYPMMAQNANLSGKVKVQVVIGTDGLVKDVKVMGGHPLFVGATLEALKKWKYPPSTSETTATLEFNFLP